MFLNKMKCLVAAGAAALFAFPTFPALFDVSLKPPQNLWPAFVDFARGRS